MKRKKKLLTYILTICMAFVFLFSVNMEPVQAASQKGIYLCTYTLSKGKISETDGNHVYSSSCSGKFVYECSFNQTVQLNLGCREIEKDSYNSVSHPFSYYDKMKKGTLETIVVPKSRYSISAYVNEVKSTAKGTVKVYFVPTCSKIEMNTHEMELAVGGKASLSVTISPSKYVKYLGVPEWSSSNEAVVKVDQKGNLTPVAAGTAKITAQLDGKRTHCAITVRDLGDDVKLSVPSKITLSKNTYTYSGKENKPKVTVYDKNGKKISSKYYTVTYSDNVNAGKATVTVDIAQSISGDRVINATTLTKTFTIKPLKASKMMLAKSSYTYTYKKNGFCPKVTVYDSKGKKISSKEYTVTYKNNDEGGTAKAIVQMNQNYGNKKFTKTFTIKYDAKTNQLLPKEKAYISTETNGKSKDVLYYIAQSEKNMKELLPYGDLDVQFDEIYTSVPFLNEKAFWPDNRNYGRYTGKYLRESYNGDEEYATGKFTGTISDLIQCVIHSPITEIVDTSREYSTTLRINCKDGNSYYIRYGNWAGMQYSEYSDFEISFSENNKHENRRYYEYHAIIKVDKSKTPWGE